MPQPRSPRNTTRAFQEDPAEPLLLLAEGMSAGGPAGFIAQQEADGQRQLVNSDVIPADGDDAELEALGFKLGPVVDGDPLFRQAALPDGWRREASDHAMASYVVDELGRRRCFIFYKAAFYDRSANIRVETVSGYIRGCLHHGTEPVLDDQWATKPAVLTAIDEEIAHHAEKAAFWTEHSAPEYVQEHIGSRKKCEALKARIERSGAE